MKKRTLSLFCALLLLLQCVPAVSGLEGEARRAADTLITLGLLDEEESYEMSAPIDRVSATVMLVRLSGADSQDASKVTSFRDVPKWADASVAYAVHAGWVNAASDNTFGPEQNLTANAWFSMLLRMLGYQDSKDEFQASDAAVFARRIGLASRAYTGIMTFGDVCESALEALRFRYPDSGATVIESLVEAGVCAQSAVNALGLNRPELTARQAADRYMSAVFAMTLYDTSEPIEESEPSADASGFFVTPDGIAVTNYHSIDGALQAVVTLVTGESFPVERVIWYDAEMDLAVIRVSRTALDGKEIPSFACLEIAGTTDIRAGDTVYALGNPLGLGLAVSEGVISATAREVERYKLPCVMNTADISQGSSGGALLNVFGRVIAVTSGAYRLGNGMYLAAPADIIETLDLTGSGETLPEVDAKENAERRGKLVDRDDDGADEEEIGENQEPS